MDIILEGIVGSTAYGLGTPTSDIDKLGVFCAEPHEILSLHPPTDKSVVRHDPEPDSTHHELTKYLGLALKANPTVLELMWLPEYTIQTKIGKELIGLRDCFLSQRVRATYGGYARQQLTRLIKRGGTFSPQTNNRTNKHGRHLRRLMFQLEGILQTGQIQIKLTPEQIKVCRETGDLAENDHETLAYFFEKEITRLDEMETDLPHHPDEKTINDFLVKTRMFQIENPIYLSLRGI